MNRNRKWHILFSVLILAASFILYGVVFTLPALAEENEPTAIKSVSMWLYPEYDDPRLLVMLEGEIVGASVPATVRFLVPTGAEMYSAGSIDAAGRYSGGPPRRSRQVSDGWDEISYEVTSKLFRVEYYHDAIQGASHKTILSEFIPLYPIDSLIVYIQRPRQASDFSISTKNVHVMHTQEVDDQGFATELYGFPNIDQGEQISFFISYTKSNPLPSLQIEESSTTPWFVVGGVVGACILLGIGLYWALRKPTPKMRKTSPKKRQEQDDRRSSKTLTARFCFECGNRLEGSPRFCPECGTKLRE